MQRKFYTAVFEVHDQKKFGRLMTKLLETMADDDTVYRGARVTAFGQGDFATQAEAYEAEVVSQGLDPTDVVHEYLANEHQAIEESFTEERLDALVDAVMGQ